ncbi:UNVERIFIED_CONTAM: hypothetical protein FKN15_026282 [Acipenser sinensis]
MDLKELIEMINRNTAAQKEQTKKWRQELGLPDPEPTELDLLLQKWEQAWVTSHSPKPEGEELPLPEPRGEEPPLPEPRGEELPLPEPRGEELPLPEPRGEELPLPEPRGEELPLPEPRGEELPLPEPRGEELPLPEGRAATARAQRGRAAAARARGEELPLPEPRGEEPPLPEPRGEKLPLPEPRGEEAKSIPPPQPRPPPLRSSLAQLRAVPCPSLLDTLSVGLDLPSLDLEPRSRQKRTQFSTWFPAPLLPDTKTSLHCSQTLLTLPLVTASLPLSDRTTLHWVPAADLCLLLQPPVPWLSFQSPLTNRWGPSSPVHTLPGWARTWTDPPSSSPVEEGEN